MTATPTPRKYATLKRQSGKKGTQKGPEAVALRRVMRHQGKTRSEARAYIEARTGEGKSVGGFTPSPKQRKLNDGRHKPKSKGMA